MEDSPDFPAPENKPQKAKPKKPRLRKTTKKQAAFVANLMYGGLQPVDAVIKAGYDCKDRDNAGTLASQLLRNTTVVSALRNEIEKGDYDQDFRSTWKECLNDDSNNYDKANDRVSVRNTKLKALDQIAKIGGLIAPVKSETKTLTLKANLFPDPQSRK